MSQAEFQVLHYSDGLINPMEIADLEQVSFENPWSHASLRDEFANPLNLTSIIQIASGPEVAGYSLTRIIPPEAELLRLAILPRIRRQGAAAILLDEVLKKIRSFKVEKIYLEVSEKNYQAVALYQKIGFEITAKRTNYYDEGTTGALMMTLHL